MKIIPLSEGAFTIGKTKEFIPFNLVQDDLQQRATGSLLVEIQPFVIVTSKDIILMDTGLGLTGRNDILQIHENLAANNLSSHDITKVLLSHLHKDHSGGVSKKDKVLSKSFLSFPNATYYVNRQEMEMAISKGLPSYTLDDFTILNDSANVIFTEGDGTIDNYIQYLVSGAHTPFHQVFWVTENDEKIFFGGDVAPQLQQMKNRFVAKYDYDGKKAMELRQQWWKEGEKENWTFLFYHDIKQPVFDFHKKGLP